MDGAKYLSVLEEAASVGTGKKVTGGLWELLIVTCKFRLAESYGSFLY